MRECNKCEQFWLGFSRNYAPQEFIEGHRASAVWIVGLNPAIDVRGDYRTTDDLKTYFDDENNVHGYFKEFKRVSPRLYALLGKKGGVARTDLVKCHSKTWPPNNMNGKDCATVVKNCRDYLQQQPSVVSHK